MAEVRTYIITLPQIKKVVVLDEVQYRKVKPLLKYLKELAKDCDDLAKTYHIKNNSEERKQDILRKIRANYLTEVAVSKRT